MNAKTDLQTALRIPDVKILRDRTDAYVIEVQRQCLKMENSYAKVSITDDTGLKNTFLKLTSQFCTIKIFKYQI